MTKLMRLLMTGLVVLAALPAWAQTVINSTTLAAAVANQTVAQFQLASTSNISAGDTYAIVSGGVVREAGIVRTVASPYVTVTRAAVPVNPQLAARQHAAGTTVYTGPRNRFATADVAGSCVAGAVPFLPRIALDTGYVYQCNAGGVWYRLDQTFTVACQAQAVADMLDQSCWTADGDYLLVGATFVSTVAESAGTLTTILKKQVGTAACASGTALTSAISAVAATTAAQTVTSYTLSATGSALLFSSGNRACIDFTDDTAGELAGVTVTLTLSRR